VLQSRCNTGACGKDKEEGKEEGKLKCYSRKAGAAFIAKVLKDVGRDDTAQVFKIIPRR
jgi:hypothetical protein